MPIFIITMQYITVNGVSKMLGISNDAVIQLVNQNIIPYNIAKSDSKTVLVFNIPELSEWIAKPDFLTLNDNLFLDTLKSNIVLNHQPQIRALKNFDNEIKSNKPQTDKKPKNIYLEKVPAKKRPFTYYVRYRYNGKIISSRWTTGTDDWETAMLFAIENRERIIAEHFAKKEARQPKTKLFDVLNDYYKKDSQYMKFDASSVPLAVPPV